MEIEIKNFGPISYLKFDIDKDLHLIYGKNAVGKSYATYCIYCLLKNLSNEVKYKYRSSEQGNIYKNNLINKLAIYGAVVDIEDFCRSEIQNSISNILSVSIKNSFQNTFSSFYNLTNQYSKLNYEIVINLNDKEKINVYPDKEKEVRVEFISNKYIEVKVCKVEEKGKITYELISSDEYTTQVLTTTDLAKYIDEYINATIIDVLDNLTFEFRDIYYLPASRSGLYQALNSFTPIIAELTQSRFFLKNKSIELPSLSEPLADYFIDLSTLNKDKKNDEFDEIIAFLEKDILKGKVDYNEDTKRIMYEPNDTTLKLNLSEASSMVSELSPLVIYFKYIINNKYYSNPKSNRFDIFTNNSNYKDIIFIEEPEAHLHPEIQVKLMELFVKLTNLNLKIFITSHSNYMFNKLNNLIISGQMDYKNVMVYHLVHTDKGSINDHEMTPTKEGMNDENFQDVSQQLYYERMNFLEENESDNN